MYEQTMSSDLEFSVARGTAETYTLNVRDLSAVRETDDRVEVRDLVLDRVALRRHELNPEEYGRVLSRFLFQHAAVLSMFAAARAGSSRLRVRLCIGASAPELQALRWETLADPHKLESPLLHSPEILFSRYLSSFDWRPVRLRPRDQLRVLVVIADPFDQGLPRIDVQGELRRARAALVEHPEAPIMVTEIVGGEPGRAVLARVIEALRDDFDVLYLVCHGAVTDAGPVLYLEHGDGCAVAVTGGDLAQKLAEVEHRPRLVVLASCESAGPEDVRRSVDGEAQLAIGPLLTEAGVAAVVAMSGQVLMETVERFMPAFFSALARDGIVDHAMAWGRSAIDDREESWRPVLFMRLRRGRIWYDAGFSSGVDAELRCWPGLLEMINQGECTPILGPGLLESFFDYKPWLARRWSASFGYPLAPAQREDLAEVAQFLTDTNGDRFLRSRFGSDLAEGLAVRLGADPQPGGPGGALERLLEELVARRGGRLPDPYRILASLPLPVYFTTSPDRLLFRALETTPVSLTPGVPPELRRPREGALIWKRSLRRNTDLAGRAPRLPDPWAMDPGYEPSVRSPLVYYLFGTLGVLDSLVLNEDDRFDYLLNSQKQEVLDGIREQVWASLTSNKVLFLGFSLDSWEFRAIFRMIQQQEVGLSAFQEPHVAVQMEPEEGRVVDPSRARAHLASTLAHDRIDLYFGTAERFLEDLAKRRAGGAR